MPLARRLYLLPLVLACVPLVAGDTDDKESHHPCWDSEFGAYAMVDVPLHDLGASLDHRTGFGLGAQWIHDHGEHHASRTRLEYNVFAESDPLGTPGTKTYAKNYLLGFDHLFRLNSDSTNVYLVAGLGGVRWVMDQTIGSETRSTHTTKLAITGGLGVEINRHMNLEARYVFSGIDKTFDSNVLQACVGWRF